MSKIGAFFARPRGPQTFLDGNIRKSLTCSRRRVKFHNPSPLHFWLSVFPQQQFQAWEEVLGWVGLVQKKDSLLELPHQKVLKLWGLMANMMGILTFSFFWLLDFCMSTVFPIQLTLQKSMSGSLHF